MDDARVGLLELSFGLFLLFVAIRFPMAMIDLPARYLARRTGEDYREVYSLSVGYGVRCLNILYGRCAVSCSGVSLEMAASSLSEQKPER